MLKVIIGILLLALIVVGALASIMMWLVKSRYRGKKAPAEPVLEAVRTPTSKLDTCAGCGEQRIIVSESEGMCATCYSALRTKKV